MKFYGYLDCVLKEMPRILVHLDRNPLSSTFGCFDRDYWHNTFIDFSCARKQEAVLTLAILYNLKEKENIYYNNPNILNWINGSLVFWSKIQSTNGSFSEWYPKENSFVATAFSTYAISETLLILGDKIKNRSSIIKSVEKAANFLLKKKEIRAQNQESGAALTLLNTFLLTKKTLYQSKSKAKINNIINNQTKEGWWHEYGGLDIGYLSLNIDYLAKYYNKTSKEDVLNKKLLVSLKKATKVLRYFIHPDFTFGGEYGSRNTEYMIPEGFEILKKVDKNSKIITSAIKYSLERNSSINPGNFDDRYLLYISYTFLQAYKNSDNTIQKLKFEKKFVKSFKEAGLYILNNNSFYFICNLKKSSLYIFNKKNKKSYFDSGILAIVDNISYSSSYINHNCKYNITSTKSDSQINISSTMQPIKKNLLDSKTLIALRVFQLTIGQSESASAFVKNRLRDKLITNENKSDMTFERKIILQDDQIIITDKVNSKKPIKKIILGEKYSQIYTPSSRFFQNSALDAETFELKPGSKNIKIIRKINKNKKMSIQKS